MQQLIPQGNDALDDLTEKGSAGSPQGGIPQWNRPLASKQEADSLVVP